MEIRMIQASEVIPLRHEVLRPHQPIEACIYPDDHAEETFHLGGIKNGCIVAIGTFSKCSFEQDSEITYQLRGMATSPDVRGEGFGKALLEEARNVLVKREARGWWCNARLVAVPFYEQIGLTIASESFEIEGIGPHHVMVDRFKA
ncbi:GNAT family N-acetyltransferase [Exiguobacterium sp. KRL4]|uniref:GNAT family N-acetyltransferase n=1 Tax=Exiguobacterium sp. KRL4 TaxID=1914536 RepID=UPI0008F80683|nr:GNAT family N-acetyltransferase [Exiguobacterium sp. KRL4]OIN68365.1 GNAT family N-acetyltransferase [Exiguobacterium sp. KRL4]